MQSPTSSRADTRPRRVSSRTRWLSLTVVAVLGGCSSSSGGPAETTIAPVPLPTDTAVAPGSCDPSQNLAPPEIRTDGTTTLATLGIGDFDCAGLNGDGYISFNYNPVLIEGAGEVEVRVADGVAATLTWSGAQPFTESSPGVWTSTLSDDSCERLTIALVSANGASTATYGADVRSGGDAVDCPQREIDPSDPSDADDSLPAAPPTT